MARSESLTACDEYGLCSVDGFGKPIVYVFRKWRILNQGIFIELYDGKVKVHHEHRSVEDARDLWRSIVTQGFVPCDVDRLDLPA